MAVDARGDVYIADGLNSVVWRVSPEGRIARFAGTESPCTHVPRCGDGGPARDARFDNPAGVAVGPHGEVYIVDQGANEVRKVSPSGTIARLAGTGRPCPGARRCGDGGRAISARLNQPSAVAVDQSGNVYIADYSDDEVRTVSPSGTITRFAGTGTPCTFGGGCGDGGSATHAKLFSPAAVAIDRSGNVYIADSNDHEVRKVSPGGRITRFAGDGRFCSSVRRCGDGLLATRASLAIPFGVAVDTAGNVYITDLERNDVREVSSSGTISRIAGSGRRCASASRCGDGGLAISANLNNPEGIAVDAALNVYIADSGDQEVRKVSGGAP